MNNILREIDSNTTKLRIKNIQNNLKKLDIESCDINMKLKQIEKVYDKLLYRIHPKGSSINAIKHLQNQQ